MKKTPFLIFFILVTLGLNAQDTIIISDKSLGFNNYDSLEKKVIPFYVDSTGELTFTDVVNKEFELTIRKEQLNSRCIKNSNWYKIIIKNEGIRYRRFVIGVSNIYFPKYIFSVYDTTLKGNIVARNSSVFPHEERDIVNRNYIPINFFLDINQTKTLFLNIKPSIPNTTNWLDSPKEQFGIGILDEVVTRELKLRVFQGIVIGFLVLLFLYNFILFLRIKTKDYLYFSLFCFNCLMFYLCASGLIYEIWSTINSWVTPIFIFLMLISFLLYSLHFIDIRKRFKRITIIIYIGVAFCGYQSLKSLFAAFDLAYTFFSFLEIIPFNFLVIISFLIILISLVPYVILAFKKEKLAIYFLLANISFFLGGLIYQYAPSPYSKYGLVVGSGIQMLLFAYIQAEKMNISNRDKLKASGDLINQLEVNADLQVKVNRELEDKVKERTLEIETQKEEILAQSEEISAQRDLLLQHNKDIIDSIEYAKFIQQALLTSHEILDNCNIKNFILYKPRDIVSGDFYWFKQIKNYLYFTAADCTGHGVPGAFMSVLGISLLNEIIGKRDLNPPAVILNELRKRLKKSLKQDILGSTSKDGMDITLCLLDLETKNLQYAGAYNPLFLFRDNNLIECKVDHMPIGIHPDDSVDFTNHEIELYADDMIYIFSDGFVSQFGGEEGKKFNVKQFKNLLTEINSHSIDLQKQMLDKRLAEWQKDNEQVDDILVIGIRI